MSATDDLDQRFEELARKIYGWDGWDGRTMDPEAVRLIAQELTHGLELGFGSGLNDLRPDSHRFRMMQFMSKNVFVFSGFKTHKQLTEISSLLYDAEGNLRPFTDFLKDVRKVNATYNTHYLNAEYNHAVASSQMSANWQSYMDNIDVAPFLKYQTAGDERVREEHRGLDGTIRRKEDPFWDTWYPPNGWNCRCDVVELVDAPDGEIEPAFLPEKQPAMFKNNVGKDGIVFPDTHPYFDAPKQAKSTIYEAAATAAPYVPTYESQSGGRVLTSVFHKAEEMVENQMIAQKLADQGHKIELLPYQDIDFRKNPDARINGKVADFKWPSKTKGSVTTISYHISEASKQGASLAVLYLDNPDVTRKIVGQALNLLKDPKRAANIKEVWLMNKGGELSVISRTDINSGKFWSQLIGP